MTMRNNPDPISNYVNGSTGTLINYDEHQRKLIVMLDGGQIVIVEPFVFESIEYKYNKKEDKIQNQPTGTFTQYPIKLAYAMSIHKSQGRTFEKVIIDMGPRGAFAHGQTYVALSRCTSLKGITLIRPITRNDLIYNQHILEFNK